MHRSNESIIISWVQSNRGFIEYIEDTAKSAAQLPPGGFFELHRQRVKQLLTMQSEITESNIEKKLTGLNLAY